MFDYQDSDDEIYWGARTLREKVLDELRVLPGIYLKIGNSNNIMKKQESLETIEECSNDIIKEEFTDIKEESTISVTEESAVSISDESGINILEESFKFNDTLEELERFLNEGPNYASSEQPDKNDIKIEEPEVKSQKTVQKQKPTQIPVPKSTTKTVVTPLFHTPRPPLEKPTNSNHKLCFPLSPKPTFSKPFGKNLYKGIESPVGLYIKNSGTVPLFKTVTPGRSNKENIPNSGQVIKRTPVQSLAFPSVKYKPSQHQEVTNDEFKLPPSISNLIPMKPKVVHHQGRIGGRKVLEESVMDGDLTTAYEGNTTQDVSILERKIAFM